MRAIIVIVALLSLGAMQAQPKPKVYGVGVQSCADWLKADGTLGVERLAIIAWTTGYVTGAAAIAASHGITLRETTGQSIVEAIGRHCKSRTTVEEAAASLVRELSASSK